MKMKSNAVFVLFLSLITLVKAQNDENEKNTNLKFGARLGITISNYVSEHTDFFESDKKGFTGALYTYIPVSDHFIFIPEITFTQKGTDRSSTGITGTTMGGSQKVVIQNSKTFSYLEIPLNMAYRINAETKVYGGLNPAILLSAKNDVRYKEGGKDGHPELPSEGEYDVKDSYETLDLGLNIGFNYHFTNHINVDVRYTYGFSDISLNDANISNRTISFGLGYTL